MICHLVYLEVQDRESIAVACPVTHVSISERHANLPRKSIRHMPCGELIGSMCRACMVQKCREIREKHASYIGIRDNYRLE